MTLPIWRNGFIKIKRVDNVDNVGAYITKYMTKDSIDERLKGKKCYTMSKGLKKPKEYTNNEQIEEIMGSIDEKEIIRTREKECESEYYGIIRYVQIILKNPLQNLPKRKSGFFDCPAMQLVRLSDDIATPFDD